VGRRVIAAPPPVRGPLVAGLTSSSCLFFLFLVPGDFGSIEAERFALLVLRCGFSHLRFALTRCVNFFFLAALPGVFVGDANTLS
jgi:hypothetical protein